jgi:type VI secretion system protein VasG
VDEAAVTGARLGCDEARRRRDTAERRWRDESELVSRLLKWAEEKGPPEGLGGLEADLARLRGTDEPLVHPWVDGWAVAAAVSRWTGIPTGRLRQSERLHLRGLESRLADHVRGQSPALRVVCQALQAARLGLADARRPAGAFLLVGPPGVGKTETAKALAEDLFGGPRHLLRFDLAEFREEHKIALLIGSPPGYVGFGAGGTLTEAVRRRPYSIVLLEQIEDGHDSLLPLFAAALSDGQLTDSEGRPCDLRNTVFALTTRIGSEAIPSAPPPDLDDLDDLDDLVEALRPALEKRFGDSFVRLLTVAPFFPLSPEAGDQIVGRELERLRDALRRQHGVELHAAPAVLEHLRGRARAGSARDIEALLRHEIHPALTPFLLDRPDDAPPENLMLLLDASGAVALESKG